MLYSVFLFFISLCTFTYIWLLFQLQSLAFGHEKPKKKGGATNGTSSAKVNGGPAPAIKKNKTNGVASNGVPSKKEKAVTDDWKIRDQKVSVFN